MAFKTYTHLRCDTNSLRASQSLCFYRSIMAITTLCAVVATLRVLPHRAQFFTLESFSMSCEQQGTSSGWTVRRNTSRNINEECFKSLDETNESQYSFDTLYLSDSGVYWCESAAGECSKAVHINVTRGNVILESPALPVMEGDDVTLRCRNRTTASSNSTADFYKDGLLIRSSSTGNMTIHSVSKADEGLYKCKISGVRGQSPDSWLTVRGRPEVPNSAPESIFPVVVVCLILILVLSVMLFGVWSGCKAAWASAPLRCGPEMPPVGEGT
uniref:low affinity immunoglobulin gamma Fc region receptor II-like n=1 Tax=Semicossyphus pulcher TaxID=241346 RepID=UPI0037E78E10